MLLHCFFLSLSLLFLFPSAHISTEQCMGIDGVFSEAISRLGMISRNPTYASVYCLKPKSI